VGWWRRQSWSDDAPKPKPTPLGNGSFDNTETNTEAGVRVAIPTQVKRRPPEAVAPVSIDRVADALKRLSIRYLTDQDGNLLAMWEKHVVLFALEGPGREVLVMRARAYNALPPDWSDRAYAAVNEWNHTRRFLKSYVGDETESGRLSLYAEMQLPMAPGVHDALLDELIDCAAAVSGSWANWLHDEGALL
jgi:hypothetical protein